MQLDLAPRTCPVCGSSDDSRVYAPAHLDLKRLDTFAFASRKTPEYMHARLIECPTCELVYANPAPTVASLSAAYRSAAFDSGGEARLASRTYARFLPHILERLEDRECAVDIGTGEGSFLRELVQAGFSRVVGIEPSQAPVETAEPDVRPLIRQEMFTASSFPPQSLSLLCCFQTIEHLSDPLQMCRDAFVLLKPGGVLFLIGHNRRALSARLLGRKSPIFDIEHLQLFSPASLTYMLQKVGFQDVSIMPVVNRYPLHYWARLFPFPLWLKRPLVAALRRVPGEWFQLPISAGNMAAIACKPKTGSNRPSAAVEKAAQAEP